MKIPEQYIELRKSVGIDSVSMGYRGVHIFKPGELESAQVGYRYGKSGESLMDNSEGSWRENWLVIGYEDECGDPIFIDMDDGGYPVYTAMSGEGKWNPDKIAVSFESFMKSLRLIKNVAYGRENPVKLEIEPPSQEEIDEVLASIEAENGGAGTLFWESWLER